MNKINNNHPADSKKSFGKSQVPKANIIDLRAVERRRSEQQSAKQRAPLFSRFKRMTLPTIRMPFRRDQKSERLPSERVIISHTTRQENKVPKPLLLTHVQDHIVKETVEKPVIQKEKKKKTKPVETKIEMPAFVPLQWKRTLLAFVAICILLIVPFYIATLYERASAAKGTVIGMSSDAYKHLQDAGTSISSSSFNIASDEFGRAAESFSNAKMQLEEVGGVLLDVTELIPNKARSAQHLLTVGEELSVAGGILADLVDELEAFEINPIDGSGASLTDFLLLVRDQAEPLQKSLTVAADSIELVRIEDIPEELQSEVSLIQQTIPAYRNSFSSFESTVDVLLEVLGHDAIKRYLLLFQNNRELRATGGFIGSIALVDIFRGSVENLEVPGGGVYDIAGQLNEKIESPRPLWLVNSHWNIQDANWFFDFPTSAQKIMWFFERTAGASADGIITLTPTVIEKLLDVTGPIDMQKEYGVTVDSSNFVSQAQYWAEIAYDREENQPKKFIADLMPLLLEKVFEPDSENLLKVVGAFYDAMTSKDLLMYFNESAVQERIVSLKAAGDIKNTDRDYLAVVDTNIGGGKTSHVVDQFIEHHAEIQNDGSIVNTVSVTRIHRGNPLDLWEGVANVSYLRFYVPAGSELISAVGFDEIPASRFLLPDLDAEQDEHLLEIEGIAVNDERTGTRITAESGKTVFGNWVSVDPGDVKKVTIQYTLPVTLELGGILNKTDVYSLLVQSQPGASNVFLASTVSYPDNHDLIWYPDSLSVSEYGTEYISDLTGDTFYGILLGK